MKQVKATRGRPKGTGINDKATLLKVAGLILDNSELKPTTAIKQLGIDNPSIIRRLRDKFNETQTALMAQARAARGGKVDVAKPGKGKPVKHAPVASHGKHTAAVRFAAPAMLAVPKQQSGTKLGSVKLATSKAPAAKVHAAGKAPVASKSSTAGKTAAAKSAGKSPVAAPRAAAQKPAPTAAETFANVARSAARQSVPTPKTNGDVAAGRAVKHVKNMDHMLNTLLVQLKPFLPQLGLLAPQLKPFISQLEPTLNSISKQNQAIQATLSKKGKVPVAA